LQLCVLRPRRHGLPVLRVQLHRPVFMRQHSFLPCPDKPPPKDVTCTGPNNACRHLPYNSACHLFFRDIWLYTSKKTRQHRHQTQESVRPSRDCRGREGSGELLAQEIKTMAEANRELERRKIDVQLKLFVEQMDYQREKDRRLYKNARIT
jgi:hypothetical protein